MTVQTAINLIKAQQPFDAELEALLQASSPQRVLELAIDAYASEDTLLAKYKLVDLLIEKGASLANITPIHYLNELELLVPRGANKQILLTVLLLTDLANNNYDPDTKTLNRDFNQEKYLKVKSQVEYLLNSGASLENPMQLGTTINGFNILFPEEFLEFLIARGMPADKLLEASFRQIVLSYKNDTHIINDAYVATQSRNILIAAKHGANVKKVFEELHGSLSIQQYSANIDLLARHIKPQELLEKVVTKYSEAANLIKKYEIVDRLIEKGASLADITELNYQDEIEFLVPRGANKQLILANLLMHGASKYNFDSKTYELNQEKYLKVKSQVEYLLDNGASLENPLLVNNMLYSLSSYFPEEFFDFLISRGLPADKLLETSLQQDVRDYTANGTVDPRLLEAQKNNILLAVKHGADIATAFEEIPFYRLFSITKDTLVVLHANGLSADAIMEKGLDDNILPTLVETAIELGANPNYTDSEDDTSALENVLAEGNIELAKKLLKAGADKKVSDKAFAAILAIQPKIDFYQELQKLFPEVFNAAKVHDFLRAHGFSHTGTNFVIDLYNFSKDASNHIPPRNVTLGSFEASILSDYEPCPTLNALENTSLTNAYGFTPLQLAFITHEYQLALQLLQLGHKLTDANIHDATALNIYSIMSHVAMRLPNINHDLLRTLKEDIVNRLDNVDVISEGGESLVDGLLHSETMRDVVLAKSKDPLFQFLKNGTDLLSASTDKIHIGISHGNGYWSTGVNTVARLIMQNNPDVEFHMISQPILDQGGDTFIRQFDGWINPGGGDSYPRDRSEFNKTQWAQSLDTEVIYQFMLNKTHEFGIPYVGMCAGAQNFALFHDGYLYPLKGYNHGQHTVTFLDGTLAHYNSMRESEKEQALKTCEFPKIEYQGDTAHNFAAVSGKLGNRIQLGAVSEDGVPMSFAHENGIRFATQYHPEHHYNTPTTEGVNYQRIWLENFVDMARMHHDAVHSGGEHPLQFMAKVKERLDACVEEKICLVEEVVNPFVDVG
jgi:anthranilate/para-aminobenzoate synthase component II